MGVKLIGGVKNASKKSQSAIMTGVIAGILLVLFNSLGIVLPIILYRNCTNLLSIIDTVIIGILTFGVYKKNRTCAILVLLFYVFEIAVKVIYTGSSYFDSSSRMFFVVFIVYGFIRGIMGTFSYHKEIKNIENNKTYDV